MKLSSEQKDELGITHLRYQQFYRAIKVEGAEYLVRARDGWAISANGHLAYDFQPEQITPQIAEERAWEIVHEHIPAERYLPGKDLAAELGSENAGYRPKGELLFTEDPKSTSRERRLAWMFKVYVTPFDRSQQIYVDASNGSIIKEFPLFPPCYLGSGPVTFRGTRSINTQRKGDRYYLVDDCDGTLLSAVLLDTANKAVAVSDDDNNWTGNNPSLVTSYWGLRACYDYFALIHKRISYDGKNSNMTIYNDPNMINAGQNATGGSGAIRIGLANPSDNDDYNTLDIVGHEFTHSLIEQTANLTYDKTKESAALDESFCDIFGQSVEQWIEGETKKEWVIGDDKGCVPPAICRDLQNPKTFNNPDTYQGTYWQTVNIDPHNNGSVQNRWFALLCDGGTGTNTELGSAYTVTGVGMAKGRAIAYRSLTQYLTSAATFPDARAASINAADDLYGSDSAEVESVRRAWCAVGLCDYVIPTQPDWFDQPGHNPNPASPDNNNTLGGATPLGTGERFLSTGSHPWSSGKFPSLHVPDLNIYPANDLDYFSITFPEVNALGGRCFSSGFAFDFGSKVNARIYVRGVLTQSYTNTSYFAFAASSTPEPIVLEISAPVPGQILSYSLNIVFYLHYRSDCFLTNPPTLWEEIRNCPMCNLQVLHGFDEVILNPFYRTEEKVPVGDHYFYWAGQGALEIPVTVLKGNNLHVDVVDQSGRVVTTADRTGPNDLLLNLPQAPPGVYSLRFSGFGNGTELLVRTPREQMR